MSIARPLPAHTDVRAFTVIRIEHWVIALGLPVLFVSGLRTFEAYLAPYSCKVFSFDTLRIVAPKITRYQLRMRLFQIINPAHIFYA
jgi:cytochrome b subunit of formate dehydrogenase